MSREATAIAAATAGATFGGVTKRDPMVHWQRCEAEGLDDRQEVFNQIFHKEVSNADSAAIVSAMEWR